ncbi:hypothetical protein ASE76_17985 [Xylophilus sp. Leaf220]|nr:hypothetical protein ASE76_17985 [Xylophilus sp. Leaf220]
MPTWAAAGVLALLAGCASSPRGGGDGPPAHPPAGLERLPDAEPRIETIRSGGPNKPYTVAGRSYVPMQGDEPFSESGLASWYGRQFHGKPTASGERYDMYAMTAAHPTLPVPSYVRVRNPANGREAILRVNDRGPFHPGRVIDLSYTAALHLDLLRGVAPVEVTRITQTDIRTGAWRREGAGTAFAAAARAVPSGSGEGGGVAPPAVAAAVVVPQALVQPVAATRDNVPRASAASRYGSAAQPVAPSPMPPPQADAAAVAPPPQAPQPTAAPRIEVTDLRPLTALPVMSLPREDPATEPVRTVSVSPATPPPVRLLPPDPAPVATVEAPAADAGFWVQLGAFGRREGADALQQQSAPQLQGLAPSFGIVTDSGLHRLQAGPYASRGAAQAAAERIGAALQLRPVVVERR